MEISDFNSAIQNLDPQQLAQAIDYANENQQEVTPLLADIVKKAAADAADLKTPEKRHELDLALLILAAQKNKDVFPDLYRLVRRKDLADQIPENDWFFRELHRLFGILSQPDDLDMLGDLLLDANLATLVREHALQAMHFFWIEKLIPENDIIEQYRRLLVQGLDENDDWKLWMALIVHAAVVGGTKLKPQVMEILDSGKLTDQTSFVKKVVNGLFSNGNVQFREMLRKEHKGFFANMTEEIDNYCNPPKEEEVEMPGKGKPQTRTTPKIGRNDPCPCGSGKKYKKCCGK